MPVDLRFSRSVSSKRRPHVGLTFGLALFAVAACNGQTAFVEQSRSLTRDIGVVGSDEDARARLGSDAVKAAGAEGPVKRQSQQSAGDDSDSPGQSGAQVGRDSRTPDIGGIGGPVDPDGIATGVDENQRIPATNPQPPTADKQEPSPVDPVVAPTPVADKTPAPPVVTLPPTSPTPHPGDLLSITQVQPRAKVDILWVVDSSGSMAWAQNQLKSKFQSFAQKLKSTRVDFQVGVTSVDVCQVDSNTGYAIPDALCPSVSYIPDGVKVGGKVIGPLKGTLQADPTTKKTILTDTADFVESFQRTAMLGTKGSAFEHGLWAAKLAVEKALKPGGENAGFVRKDASLAVVVLSDEEDDSVQMWCEDGYGRTSLTADGKKDLNLCSEGGSSPFLDAFGIAPYALMKNSKGIPMTTHKFTADNFKSWAETNAVKGSGNFRVSAITGLRKSSGNIDCQLTTGGPEESGTNYIKAAHLTGGSVENICSSDWSSVLANIGQNTVELATRIKLPAGKIPFPGTMEVRVDGQILDANQYVYDATVHAVVFMEPPAMGAEVSVSYRETLVD
ncbi:MAG: hypothetical protein RI953_1814 [Pseudomonadota bacterium]|jgi:hypothetical protein